MEASWQAPRLPGSLRKKGCVLVLEVLDGTVEDGHVVSGHVDHLKSVGEVIQQEKVGVKVLYPCSHYYVGEDGKHLVSVKHPFLLLESVFIVKCLNLFRDSF